MLSPQQLHGYYDTVMSNPDSRKIAYFLALNLAYMGVQITYGIWTNSLGLISDGMRIDKMILATELTLSLHITLAIHMFFDCMAIAVGLLASIMATWPPNERFTYGCVKIFIIIL
jgi:zinc transporter 5/7